MSKIVKLHNLLEKQNIEAFLLSNTDEFQNEHLPEHNKRIEWLTGFTGSAATIILTQEKCGFFTDARYTLQAKEELDLDEFEIHDIKLPVQWLQQKNIKLLWYDPALHTEKQIQNYKGIELREVKSNPINDLWEDRPDFVSSKIKVHEDYAGESSEKKCIRLAGSAPFLITAPDSICWLLNIRGNDIKYTPLVLCYAILHSMGEVDLFLYNTQNINIGEHVRIHEMSQLPKILQQLQEVAFDPEFTSLKLIKLLHNKSRKKDPCQIAKAKKNSVEIEGAKKAHIRDGLAMTEFLFWLKKSEGCAEKLAAEKLLMLRKKQKLFQEPSFPTISALGRHGAIVHYTKCDNTSIKGDNFYLVDSGGQYLDGTTDVTRTIFIGNISPEQRYHYTLVLKGHIALATAVFPVGTTGKQLDILARQYLWKSYLNYNHGTGHGVGSYLGVHEGPQSFSNDVPLEIGMIISNEPGFYKEGEYGIRIESLMHVVEKSDGYLGFEVLTLVPMDTCDLSLMTAEEINWVKNYNLAVSKALENDLTPGTKDWLIAAIG